MTTATWADPSATWADSSVTWDGIVGGAASTYTLKFDFAADRSAENNSDTATANFRMIVDGVETDLGNVTSPASTTGPSFNWAARTIDVTSVFDPGATDLYVRWRYVSGGDHAHIRNVRIEDDLGNVWQDQYLGATSPYDQVAADGGSVPMQINPCNLNDDLAAYGDGYVHHTFLPVFDPTTMCPTRGLVSGPISLG